MQDSTLVTQVYIGEVRLDKRDFQREKENETMMKLFYAARGKVKSIPVGGNNKKKQNQKRKLVRRKRKDDGLSSEATPMRMDVWGRNETREETLGESQIKDIGVETVSRGQ